MTVFTFEEKIIKTDKQTRLLKLVLIVQKKIVKTCIEQLINLKQQRCSKVSKDFFCVFFNYNGQKRNSANGSLMFT